MPQEPDTNAYKGIAGWFLVVVIVGIIGVIALPSPMNLAGWVVVVIGCVIGGWQFGRAFNAQNEGD